MMKKRTAAAVCGNRGTGGGHDGLRRGIRRLGVEGRSQRRAAGHAPGRSVGLRRFQADQGAKAEGELADGVLHGARAKWDGGPRDRQAARAGQTRILVFGNRAGGREPEPAEATRAIRDGRFAAMIEPRKAPASTRSAAPPSPRRAPGRRWRTRSRRQKPPPRSGTGDSDDESRFTGRRARMRRCPRRDFLTRAGLTVEAAALRGGGCRRGLCGAGGRDRRLGG